MGREANTPCTFVLYVVVLTSLYQSCCFSHVFGIACKHVTSVCGCKVTDILCKTQ
jgi:hypothetical protein